MPFCRDQKKTRGKIRLTNMLKSGKELKVFAVRDGELRKFCEEAKKYGVLYCVLKDNNAAGWPYRHYGPGGGCRENQPYL